MQPRRSGPIEWYTVAGRLLVMVTVVGSAAAFYVFFMGTFPSFPAGKYPVAIWLVPIAIAGFLFFKFIAFALQKIGVEIYRRSESHDATSSGVRKGGR